MRASGLVVCLETPPEVLQDRVGTGEGRPLLGEAGGYGLRSLAAERAAAYAAAAHRRVATSGRAPEEVAEEVAGL